MVDQNPCAHLRMPSGIDLQMVGRLRLLRLNARAQRDGLVEDLKIRFAPVVAHKLPDILTAGFNWAIVAAAPGPGDVSGIASLGVKCQPAWSTMETAMGAGIETAALISIGAPRWRRCRPGQNQPGGALPLRGTDFAPKI